MDQEPMREDLSFLGLISRERQHLICKHRKDDVAPTHEAKAIIKQFGSVQALAERDLVRATYCDRRW